MEEIPILKDVGFWELLATTSCVLLGRMISKYIDKTEKNFEKIEDTFEKMEGTFKSIHELLNSVVTKNEVQEVRIDEHEKRLEKLEGRL